MVSCQLCHPFHPSTLSSAAWCGTLTPGDAVTRPGTTKAAMVAALHRAGFPAATVLSQNCEEWTAGWWLTYPSEKYESQVGWLFSIYGKIKNVPNHQSDSKHSMLPALENGGSAFCRMMPYASGCHMEHLWNSSKTRISQWFKIQETWCMTPGLQRSLKYGITWQHPCQLADVFAKHRFSANRRASSASNLLQSSPKAKIWSCCSFGKL